MNFHLLRIIKALLISFVTALMIIISALIHGGLEHDVQAQPSPKDQPFPEARGGNTEMASPSDQQAYQKYQSDEFKALTPLQKAVQDKEIADFV
jgi:hypothetical protein